MIFIDVPKCGKDVLISDLPLFAVHVVAGNSKYISYKNRYWRVLLLTDHNLSSPMHKAINILVALKILHCG